MANQQLITYIKSTLQKGYPAERIKQVLIEKGWQDDIVNESMSLAQEGESAHPKAPNKLLLAALIAIIIVSGTSLAFILFDEGQSQPITQPIVQEETQTAPDTQIVTQPVIYQEPVQEEIQKSVPAVQEAEIQETDIDTKHFDCGTSDSCFYNQIKTCNPAKATITEGGLTYIETTEGYEGLYCIVTLVYIDEAYIPGLVGKKMSCKVPDTKLLDFKNYLQGKQITYSCEGPLADFLIKIGIA